MGSVTELSHEAFWPDRTEQQRRGEGRVPWAGEGSARAMCSTKQLQAVPLLAQGRALKAPQPGAQSTAP